MCLKRKIHNIFLMKNNDIIGLNYVCVIFRARLSLIRVRIRVHDSAAIKIRIRKCMDENGPGSPAQENPVGSHIIGPGSPGQENPVESHVIGPRSPAQENLVGSHVKGPGSPAQKTQWRAMS